MTQLARRLGPFDATMIVMGGIIGSGIFMNPYVVARAVHTPALILGAWILGGVVALLGALVYAELASLRPAAGGQYVYLRDAYGPAVAFTYGWALLLVVQSGGMAAVAVTFSRYLLELAPSAFSEPVLAVTTLLVLTLINCLGVRSGATTQNTLMVLKLVAIGVLVVAGLALADASKLALRPLLDAPPSAGLLFRFGAAMTPVMFAYGGWQTASFVAGEMKQPGRDLVRGLLFGVGGVVAVYVAVNAVCLATLGPEGLAQTTTPASTVMRTLLGERGATFIAIGIVISTAGFLSQSMLTAPRVYYAMAEDGVFFRSIGRVHAATRAPVAAIALQGGVAIVIALSGTYSQILGYVVATDFLFFGLTGLALLLFRRRGELGRFRAPGHPVTTLLFIAACWTVVIATVAAAPLNSAIGFLILLAGLPAYAWWRRKRAQSRS